MLTAGLVERQLRSGLTSRLPLIAASSSLGSRFRAEELGFEQQNLDLNKWVSTWRFVSPWSMDFGPVSNKTKRSNFGLRLGRPQNVRGSVLLNPSRAWTMSNRFGGINLSATRAGAMSPRLASSHFSAVPAISVIPNTITNDTFTDGAGGGDWNSAGNWSAGGLPGSSNNVLITGTGAARGLPRTPAPPSIT